MRYYVTIASHNHAVDLVELPSGSIEAHLDGRPIDLDVVAIGARLNVRVDGNIVELTTEGKLPELSVVASGHRLNVRVESERTGRSAQTAKRSADGEKMVKSPMPGRVVKVLVEKGDTVRAGEGLVVLEAMKMENEIRAPSEGTVAEVHVRAGTTVEANAALVTFA